MRSLDESDVENAIQQRYSDWYRATIIHFQPRVSTYRTMVYQSGGPAAKTRAIGEFDLVVMRLIYNSTRWPKARSLTRRKRD
jgi:hypothetical protein